MAYLGDGTPIKFQLLSARGYEPWPTEFTVIEQRYSDAPSARLTVPTVEAFAGWKAAAWFDRAAPRDLHDLWGLAKVGAINAASAELFRSHGPTGGFPRPWMFTVPPTREAWSAQLSGQTILTVDPEEALREVRKAWTAALGKDW